MACGNLPGPGLEPVSPALAGRLLTTAPPGKSLWLASVTQHPLWRHIHAGANINGSFLFTAEFH